MEWQSTTGLERESCYQVRVYSIYQYADENNAVFNYSKKLDLVYVTDMLPIPELHARAKNLEDIVIKGDIKERHIQLWRLTTVQYNVLLTKTNTRTF